MQIKGNVLIRHCLFLSSDLNRKGISLGDLYRITFKYPGLVFGDPQCGDLGSLKIRHPWDIDHCRAADGLYFWQQAIDRSSITHADPG